MMVIRSNGREVVKLYTRDELLDFLVTTASPAYVGRVMQWYDTGARGTLEVSPEVPTVAVDTWFGDTAETP